MARPSLKYYWDKSVHRAANTHNSIVGIVAYGAALAGITISAGQDPKDIEMPVFEQSVQKNDKSDASYDMLNRQITQTHNEGLKLQNFDLRIAELDIRGKDIESEKEDLEEIKDQHQDKIGRLYGYLLQNEDITEAQFAQLQSKMVQYNITYDRYDIDLKNLNPNTLRECQEKFGVNDGGGALNNANGVQECMVTYSDPAKYKEQVNSDQKLGAFFGSLLILGTLGVGTGAIANRYTYRRRPRREDYIKHKHMN